MINLREQIKEIITNFAWKIHYKQCDALYIENKGINQATDQILQAVEEMLPENKPEEITGGLLCYDNLEHPTQCDYDNCSQKAKKIPPSDCPELKQFNTPLIENESFNICLTQIRERIREK